MERVADIIAKDLAFYGLRQVFMVTGGGAMHLNDAFGRCQGLSILFNHHEQASAMAAEGYARACGRPAIVNVTTGPGGINALNGVYGAYTDSIPMIVVSGQVKRDTMAANLQVPIRQFGDQEADIIPMARQACKYAVELQDPRRAREAVAKAVYVATHGRPGPVWIDVPMDVQGMPANTASMPLWDDKKPGALATLRGDPNLSPNARGDFAQESLESLAQKAGEIARRLRLAKRPVLLGGTGVYIADQGEAFRGLASRLGIPALGGWNAYDLVPNAHPCYVGRPGTVGDRAGNIAVQNADFLLTLGCRLNIRQIGFNWGWFAPKAWKAQVDVDPAELGKPSLRNDLAVCADLRAFMPLLLDAFAGLKPSPRHAEYLAWCKGKAAEYPVLQGRQAKPGPANPYWFMDRLFDALDPGDAVVTGNGTAAVVSFQTGAIKERTSLFSNSGLASMGYGLPAAIGAAVATGGKRVICLDGDGSLMMNLQELATVAGNRLPIHVFVLDNGGYHSIRQTQANYFPDNPLGVDGATGVHFPDFRKVGAAFGLPGAWTDRNEGVPGFIKEALGMEPPCLHVIKLDQSQKFEPKLQSRQLPDGTMSSPTLDDMAPFLPPERLKANRLG